MHAETPPNPRNAFRIDIFKLFYAGEQWKLKMLFSLLNTILGDRVTGCDRSGSPIGIIVADQLLDWWHWNELACSETFLMTLLLCTFFLAASYPKTHSPKRLSFIPVSRSVFFFFSGNELFSSRNYNNFLGGIDPVRKKIFSKKVLQSKHWIRKPSFSIRLNWNSFLCIGLLGVEAGRKYVNFRGAFISLS